MKRPNLDDLFLSATQGNKDAQNQLFKWYYHHAMKQALILADREGIYTFNKDEVSDKIIEMYILTLESFRINKIPFEKYADFLLNKRIVKIVNSTCIGKEKYPLSLDVENEYGETLIDLIQAEGAGYDYSKETADLIMGSKNIKKQKIDRRFVQVVKLKMKGYSKKQILKIMNITDGQYRYILRFIRTVGKGNIEMK